MLRTPHALWLIPALVLGTVLVAAPGQPAGQAQDPPPAKPSDPAAPKPLTQAEKEAEWLAGEWKVAGVQAGGENVLTDDQLKDARVVFKGNKAEVKGFDVLFVRDFTFKLDPAQKPKAIDVTFLAGIEKGETFAGCYVLHKDEVRICLRLANLELGRPKGFVTDSGAGLYTFFLKPVEKRGPLPAERKAPADPARKPDTATRTENGAPPLTVAELAAGLRDEGFQWKFVGRRITFRAVVVKAGANPEVRVEGLDKGRFDTAVLHNAAADTGLRAGDRVEVAGLIVDQWYGVWQVWRHELKKLGD